MFLIVIHDINRTLIDMFS